LNRSYFTEDLSLNNNPPWLTENEFQQKYRLTRQSFDVLLNLIKDHPVFTNNQGVGREQTVPEHQLMVLLKFLGTEGSGASNPDLRSVFFVGRGTSELFKNVFCEHKNDIKTMVGKFNTTV
jgi:hypothetical protein